jgi:hypothetical protein
MQVIGDIDMADTPLFYDAASSTGEFYTTDGQGAIELLRQHTDWRGSWNQIVPGNFGGGSNTDLLFYDAANGTGEFYTTENLRGIALLRQYTDWRRSWNQIVSGRFGGATLSNFTFAGDISAENRTRLIQRHRFAVARIEVCGNLSAGEKERLFDAYGRAIHHTTLNDPNANASATVGGSTINVNFGVLFPQGDAEISQTLIHEMMHCAGFTHPNRRDPPAGTPCTAPAFDCPGDNGPYYSTPPLRAEFCIAGNQSDMRSRLESKAANERCVIDEQGLATIHTI